MKFFAKISAFALTLSLIAAAFVPAYAAGKISYSFTGDEARKAGYAEGKITLSGLSDGKYKLFWANDTKALDGFYEICELKNGESFTFTEHTVIPPDAAKLIAVKEGTAVSDAEAVFDIPASKRFPHKSSDALYSFMNYSDIHIDESENLFYEHSELHWQKALETAAGRNADFIITAGDNVTNDQGPGKEFDKFQQILADSPYTNPVYEGSGNHELRTGNVDALLSTFVTATGLDGDKNTIRQNKPYYTVEEPNTGDLFIFMALEYKYNPTEGDEFSDKQLDWLDKILKENYGKNKNIILVQHALIEGYGAGDDEDNYYTVPLDPQYKSTVRFRDIISKYPELIWVSGHTHIALRFGYNYSNMNDTSCHMIHDSSVCCPTTLNTASHNLSYDAAQGEDSRDFTEGYYSQVFSDEVVFYGENLYHDKIYPAACYVMESCRKTAESSASKAKNTEFTTLPTTGDLVDLAERCAYLPKSFGCKGITDDDLKKLRAMSKSLLSDMYSFSSYDDYQALKKAYNNEKSDYKTLCEAYLAVLPHTHEGIVTVYFANTKKWSQPYAKLSSSKNSNGKQGEKMIKVGKDKEGNEIYKIELNYHRYSTAVFTDGTDKNQSEPQTLSGENNKLYFLNSADPTSPYYCYVRDFEGVK